MTPIRLDTDPPVKPLEEASAYHELNQAFGLTQQEIADRVGRNRVSIANALRLLRLPDFCRNMLALDKITEGHARALLGLEDDEHSYETRPHQLAEEQLYPVPFEPLGHQIDDQIGYGQ